MPTEGKNRIVLDNKEIREISGFQKPVVFDTNIIISAAVSRDGAPARIFWLFTNEKLMNYTTEEIIKELEEVISRHKFEESISEEYKEFVLNTFKTKSIIIKPEFDEKPITKDIEDNKFINCALSAKADIITGDRHLLELKNYKGIRIMDANSFLNKL